MSVERESLTTTAKALKYFASDTDLTDNNLEELLSEHEATKTPQSKQWPERASKDGMFIQKISCRMAYCLVLFLATYLLNQLDRYMLAITAKPMAQEVHFGDQECMLNASYSDWGLDDKLCNETAITGCASIDVNGTKACKWDYNGQGLDYQIVAGPVFILIYTFAGIFIAFAADRFNRKVMLASCLIFWSVMTLLTGFVKEYWHLVVLRFGLGLGEAGCTPFVASMIADMFPKEMRGTALGVYNWGIFTGYSMSYTVGNLITDANINDQGWRWAFFISGMPGIVLGVIILLTVQEPDRNTTTTIENKDGGAADDTAPSENASFCSRVKRILTPFAQASLILAILAGSVRNAAGYVFAYNTQPYFIAIKQTKKQIAQYMGWIPIVGGSLGVVVGGFVSDRVVKRGLYARAIVIIASLLVAAPFAAGTLFFDPPWAYICQIPSYIFGEMWISICLAIIVELVPSDIKTSAVAVYLFVISNIGGNMPLLVPVIKDALMDAGYNKTDALRGALYVLYPGLYVLGALLFIPAMLAMKRDHNRMKRSEMKQQIQVPEKLGERL